MQFFKKLYLKEGKGIDKDEPEKRAFFRFWEIVWVKRFKLLAINFLYFLFNLIPTVLAAAGYLLAVSFYFTLTYGVSVTQVIEESAQPESAQAMYYMGLFFVTGLFTLIPVFSAGPFRSGLTFITRSFVKREPVFLWTDFIAKTRSNKKLSLQAMLINAVVGFLLMIAIAFYLSCSTAGSNMQGLLPGWMQYVAAGAVTLVFFLFLSMNLYIYPMIVTFRLTLRQLYKNAAILVFVRWLPNLLIVLLTAAMVFVPLLLIDGVFAFIVSLVLYAAIALAFTSFLHTFYVYPVLKKYMIDNVHADRTGQAEQAGQDEQA